MTSVKTCLKRGALVAAANWHVVIVQFIADALFKVLLALPIVGGMFLVVLLIGGDPSDLLTLPVAEILPTMSSVLVANPAAFVAFATALMLVVGGGSLLMFVIKAGTVSVLVYAEQSAGAIEHPPLRLPAFKRATAFTLERFTGGARRLQSRYVRLGLTLLVIYAASTAAALTAAVSFSTHERWQLIAAGVSASLVVWITAVNFLYLLLQMVVAADDCTPASAIRRVAMLLTTRPATVMGIFVATLTLALLTTAASIVATAALGLIAFVPLVGLAALPLQLVAWVVRGVVFQYVGLTALAAYARAYRDAREMVYGSITPLEVAGDTLGQHLAH